MELSECVCVCGIHARCCMIYANINKSTSQKHFHFTHNRANGNLHSEAVSFTFLVLFK